MNTKVINAILEDSLELVLLVVAIVGQALWVPNGVKEMQTLTNQTNKIATLSPGKIESLPC